ncbi:hypothetical protein C8J48_0870 [Desmospora activa DSM 45169]|uniref:Uncharacterized protein n=1 Tax=Desmospora activa DSM 45169 TaxID=1121389 RepID=A0A2T4Z8R4_9BACL|nr:hypothetical protein C8J48_0870 [Desmospora activa DSM 45169]
MAGEYSDKSPDKNLDEGKTFDYNNLYGQLSLSEICSYVFFVTQGIDRLLFAVSVLLFGL